DVYKRQVRTVTLTELCQRYGVPGRFELLSVDCEGHDLAILRSLDFSLFRPGIVVVEIHNLALDRKDEDPICGFLMGQGYQLRAYVTKNGYFTEAG
ncbi:MAG: FkbM family methyltransferase, partial [Kiritimatiellae bacterium]|nr:FkbM family methyltransferase [Kiritimatiellia bacterium]